MVLARTLRWNIFWTSSRQMALAMRGKKHNETQEVELCAAWKDSEFYGWKSLNVKSSRDKEDSLPEAKTKKRRSLSEIRKKKFQRKIEKKRDTLTETKKTVFQKKKVLRDEKDVKSSREKKKKTYSKRRTRQSLLETREGIHVQTTKPHIFQRQNHLNLLPEALESYWYLLDLFCHDRQRWNK